MTNRNNQQMFFSLLLCAVLVFFSGCGEDPESSNNGNNGGGNNGGGNNGGGNNGGGNNGGGNNGGGNGTCTTACNVLVSNSCAGVPSQAECESSCQQSFTQQLINCISGSPTCADAETCVDTGGDNNGDNNGENNGVADGAIGADCNSNSGCDSAYCKTPAGGNQGKCAINDFGNTCESTSDCEHGACLVSSDGGDIVGYCSSTCENFTDCPTFWDCDELGNAAGTYCIQD